MLMRFVSLGYGISPRKPQPPSPSETALDKTLLQDSTIVSARTVATVRLCTRREF